MYWLANVVICLTFKSGVAGIWLATVLLYLYILNLGHTWAVRKSASDNWVETKCQLADGLTKKGVNPIKLSNVFQTGFLEV